MNKNVPAEILSRFKQLNATLMKPYDATKNNYATLNAVKEKGYTDNFVVYDYDFNTGKICKVHISEINENGRVQCRRLGSAVVPRFKSCIELFFLTEEDAQAELQNCQNSAAHEKAREEVAKLLTEYNIGDLL